MKIISIAVLFFYIIYLHKRIFALVLQERGEHSAVLIGKKLYFQGGWNGYGYANNQLFYLDISNPFDTTNKVSMPWNLSLSLIDGVTNKTGATACADGNTIFYIGGDNVGNLVSKFDTDLGQWNELTTSGSEPGQGIKFVQCTISGHKIYIYGGSGIHIMNILDSSRLYWFTFSSALVYNGTQGYSATLLNNLILYIGGGAPKVGACVYNSNNELPVSIFNTSDNTWEMVPISGQAPSPKCEHSSVHIPQHSRILLFYGYNDTRINSLEINSLDTLSFTWATPVVSNTENSPQTLRLHTSTLIGAYALIAFGFKTYTNNNASSDIFLLDVSHGDEYKWVTTYDPANLIQPVSTKTISPSSTSNNPSNTNLGAIIGGTIGGIAGLILLSTAAIISIHLIKNKYPINVSTIQDDITNQQPMP